MASVEFFKLRVLGRVLAAFGALLRLCKRRVEQGAFFGCDVDFWHLCVPAGGMPVLILH